MSKPLSRVALLVLLMAACGAGISGCATSVNIGQSAVEIRPALGVRLRVEPNPRVQGSLLPDRPQLLRVVRVYPDQPAEHAGLLVGDVVLALNETPVSGMADSVAIMQRMAAGDSVLVRVWRDKQIREFSIALVNADDADRAAR